MFPMNHSPLWARLVLNPGPRDLLWPMKHQWTWSQQSLDKDLCLGTCLLETLLRNFRVFWMTKMKGQEERKERGNVKNTRYFQLSPKPAHPPDESYLFFWFKPLRSGMAWYTVINNREDLVFYRFLLLSCIPLMLHIFPDIHSNGTIHVS